MDTVKTTSKMKIRYRQSTSTDSNDDLKEYSSINVNLEFKKQFEQLQLKLKVMNDKPSTKELLYGYFPIQIVSLIFW